MIERDTDSLSIRSKPNRFYLLEKKTKFQGKHSYVPLLKSFEHEWFHTRRLRKSQDIAPMLSEFIAKIKSDTPKQKSHPKLWSGFAWLLRNHGVHRGKEKRSIALCALFSSVYSVVNNFWFGSPIKTHIPRAQSQHPSPRFPSRKACS